MIVISIGTDKKIFELQSQVRARMKKYGKLVDELHVVVFTPHSNRNVTEQIADNVWIYPTRSRTKIGYVIDAYLIAARIIRNKNIAHTIVTSQDPFETGIVACMLSYIHKIHFLCQVHIDFFSPYYAKESIKGFIQSIIGPFIVKRAHHVRVVSRKIRQYVVESLRVSSSRVSVLPIHTDVTSLHITQPKIYLKQRYPTFSHTILIISRLVKQKGIVIGIESFKKVLEKFPEAGLIIVGSGNQEALLKKYVVRQRLQSSVVFESWTEDAASYMKTCDVFILPSLYEGWGLTVVEAAACGAPIIMTNVGCAEEFVTDGYNGLIVPVGDSATLAHKIMQVLSSKSLRDMLCQNAYDSIKKLPNETSYLMEYKNVLQQTTL